MKYISLFIVVIFLSCKHENQNIVLKDKIEKSNKITLGINDTVVDKITKNCIDCMQKNVSVYYLCNKWKLLNEKQIKQVLSIGEKGNKETDFYELHDTASEYPIWIYANIKIGKSNFKIEINPGSYFYLVDDRGNRTLYFCRQNKFRKYFVSGLGPEDDELYRKQIVDVDKQIKSINTDLTSWTGIYEFDNGIYEQGYKNYHIIIKKNSCILYQGDLPAQEVDCRVLILNNELYLYQKDQIKNAEYDITYLQNSQQGDYLLKISKTNNKYYVNTRLVKYLDEKKKKFVENYDIELNKTITRLEK